MYPSIREAIQALRGDIHLGVCQNCGHIYNTVFDAKMVNYSQHYENTLFFSPLFLQYGETLSENLIHRYDLIQKDIIAIGCGRGDFLKLLCAKGGNRGIGFDPSLVVEEAESNMSEQIRFIRDYYKTDYAHYPVDLLVCRHVLEHIENVRDFLTEIRQIIGDRQPVVYFEVPNVLSYFRDQVNWDIIYEHYSYFSPISLEKVFTDCGFQVARLYPSFGGQFLSLEALPAREQKEPKPDSLNNLHDINEICRLAVRFALHLGKAVEEWRYKLQYLRITGKKAVIWGTGSKGVNFLNMVDRERVVKYAIDINPFKCGHHVAGTGQKIMPPDFLMDYQPDEVIVMNPIYLEEIRETIERLGIKTELTPSG